MFVSDSKPRLLSDDCFSIAGTQAAGSSCPRPSGRRCGFSWDPKDREATARLLASPARVIFVALGAPKQELWMERHAAELHDRVLVGVGAAIDVLGGRVREAPRWVTSLGLEWIFRLAQEPRRLSRRYLWDDPRFLWGMVQARRGRERTPRNS